MRSRFGKVTLVFVFLLGGLIAVIEFVDSELLMKSKTYELVGYGEVDRESDGHNTIIVKAKRFGFVPGAEAVVFVQDPTGKTISTTALPTWRPGSRISLQRGTEVAPATGATDTIVDVAPTDTSL